MRDWDEAGMLPETLFDQLSWLFSVTPPTAEQAHLAVFNWWLKMPPDKGTLMKLAELLGILPLHESDRQWVADAIRMARAYDAHVEATLREV